VSLTISRKAMNLTVTAKHLLKPGRAGAKVDHQAEQFNQSVATLLI
jgi:hypothetical protein